MKLEFPTRNYNCSDKYKIIFIHVPRTGGGTINKLLEIPREDQGHRAPWEIRMSIDPGKWEEYDKIVICRNPWDRLVSLYHYRMSKGYDTHTKFAVNEFNYWLVNPQIRKFAGSLEWEPVYNILSNPNFATIKNHPKFTNYEWPVSVIPFETLSESFGMWCLKNDRNELAEKAYEHFRNTFVNKTERKDYREYYDDFGKVFVYAMMQIDEFMWGYDYENPKPPHFEEIRQSIAEDKKVPLEQINKSWVNLLMCGDKKFDDVDDKPRV